MDRQAIFNEEPKTSKVTTSVLLAMFIVGFTLWLLLYPIVSGSLVFCVGLILMAIPSYVAIESLGSLGLGAEFVNKLPRNIRILFGVLWMLVFSLILGLLSSLVGA